MGSKTIQQRIDNQPDEILDLRDEKDEKNPKYVYENEKVEVEIKDIIRILPEDFKDFKESYLQWQAQWER